MECPNPKCRSYDPGQARAIEKDSPKAQWGVRLGYSDDVEVFGPFSEKSGAEKFADGATDSEDVLDIELFDWSDLDDLT